jgi:putative transposase
MDFVHDALADGRFFRVLTVVDQWSRQSPILGVASSLSGATVGQALDRAPRRRMGEPSGTGPTNAACSSTSSLPENPWRMPLPESFNGRLRDHRLDVHQFIRLDDPTPRSKRAASTTISANRTARSDT